ncbi:MAG TPA: hypothetical protein VIR57_10915, partial [Chloroflexota bacterium]
AGLAGALAPAEPAAGGLTLVDATPAAGAAAPPHAASSSALPKPSPSQGVFSPCPKGLESLFIT